MTTDLAHPNARKLAVACASVVLLLVAGACGSGNGGNPDANGQTGEQGGPQSQQRSGPDGRTPGANGKVAAVADTTAQVQGVDGQVAVSWTGSTTFTKEVTAKLADVTVGDCVFVGSDQASSSGSTPSTAVTAATVRITPATNETCAAGQRGPGGQAGPGGPGGGPQFNGTPPSGAPTGGDRPQMRAIGGAVGKVTAVSATGFTVASMRPGNDTTTAVTVTVDSTTTYTATAKGAASDVKVGVCVAANGTTDASGAVTATTIAVSPPRDGQCGGFVRFQSSDGGGSSSKES